MIPITRDEVVAEICKKKCWNTIRWGKVPFSKEVIDTLLGHDFPQYFVIGTATKEQVLNVVREQAWVIDETLCAQQGAVCHIAGVPVFLDRQMPPNMVAVILLGERLMKGHFRYEVTRHCASWIEIPDGENA